MQRTREQQNTFRQEALNGDSMSITPKREELAFQEVIDLIKERGFKKARAYYQWSIDNGDFSNNTATLRLLKYKVGLVRGLEVNGVIV